MDAELVVSGATGQLSWSPDQGEPAMLIFLGARAPLEMFGGWRRVAGKLDARGLAKAFAVVTAFPFAFGCLGLWIGLTSDEYGVTEKVLGVAVWWSLVVVAWGAYAWIVVRSRRSR